MRTGRREDLEKEKKTLVELIAWYRHKYHRQDFGHRDLMDRTNAAEDTDHLQPIWQIVDGWIDI